MDERLTVFLADLERAPELSSADLVRCARRAKWLVDAPPDQLTEFLAAVRGLKAPLPPATDNLLRTGFEALAQERRKKLAPEAPLPVSLIEEAVACYRHLGSVSTARPHLLAWLALGKTQPEVTAVVELLIVDPPEGDSGLIQVMSPLFRKSMPVEWVFPRLLEALQHPSLASPILDLANFLTREGVARLHPAVGRTQQLIALLGNLAQALGRLEEDPLSHAGSPAELSQRVASNVALAVSLCDALGLIGDEAAAGKLHQIMSLKHRRLRTEAAAALARLSDPLAVEELKRMAAEPVARLRALTYAEELGLSKKIDPQFTTPQARAEAELIAWLAEPTQFGIPPSSCELVDQRKQFWPGFNEPVECFLFRFAYSFAIDGQGERSFSNVGIAGPMVHAFTADVADLPPQDIYAAYAGWQAEHEEIYEYEVARLSRSERLEVVRLERRLHDAGYEDIEPQQMGYFFGGKALLAAARRAEVRGVAVVDFDDVSFFPQRHSRRSLGIREAYSIYKGRKLLKTFNAPKSA